MNDRICWRTPPRISNGPYDRSPRRLPRVRACAAAVASALIGGTALAQDVGPVEEIMVTGSRIATSGANTPTPVTAVGVEDLQSMAPGTFIDALKQLPQFYNTITTQQAVGGSVASGGSNVNLRGAGAERTLVLLDGRRVGPANKFGTVDIGIIPETLVRSVEAVTGGASAAYGADAVSGVVNFLLDTDFAGVKYSAQVGTTTYGDGDNYRVGIAYGTDVGQRGHIIASAEYFETDGIEGFGSLQDRSDFYDLKALVTNPDPNGPTFLTRRFVSPTNYTAGGIILEPGSSLDHVEFLPDGSGQFRPLPFSGVGRLSGGCNCQARPTLEYGVDSDTQVDTPADRTSLFAHYDLDLNERNTFFAETLLANNFTDPNWQTVALLGPWQGRLFVDNPFLPEEIRQTMEEEGLESVGFGIFTPNLPGNPFSGARLQGKNRYVQVTTGFSHSLSDSFLAGGWTLDTYVQYAQNKQETIVPGGMRVDRLFFAMDAVTGPDGNPVCRVTLANPGVFDKCVPINLIGGLDAVTPEAARYVTDDGKVARGRTTEKVAEVTLTGDLTSGSGVLGPISAAFGLSWRQQNLRVRTPDPCDEFPCTVDNVRLSDLGFLTPDLRGVLPETDPRGIPGLRHVPAGFAGDANSSTVLFSSQRDVLGGYSVREAFVEFHIPLFDGRLNLDEAYRFASYTGSGDEPAWKTSVSFQATERFRIRATRSQDVRAPTLRERFEQQRGGVNVRDPLNNNDTISTASFSGGNPNVGLETATTNTIGFVFEPLDRFSVTLDWYDIDLDGAIGQLGFQTIVDTCAESGGTSSLCEFVIRDAANQIVRVDNLFINLSNQRINGVDAEFNLTGIELGGGTLGWRLFATRLNENSVLTPGSPRDERAGDIGLSLPEDKVTTSLTYSRGPWSLFLQGRYIGDGILNRNFEEGVDVDDNTVSSVFYTDLTFRFSGRDGAAPWQVFFTANNVFDRAPPDTFGQLGRAGVPGPNSILYDTIGRRFTAGVRVSY
ncbi:MAG TPA: TonB-dependent receptor plug domain-containing protein [Gammaproteobacteria bacterium]